MANPKPQKCIEVEAANPNCAQEGTTKYLNLILAQVAVTNPKP